MPFEEHSEPGATLSLDKHISIGNIISIVAMVGMSVGAYANYKAGQAELIIRVERVEERSRENSEKIESQRSELLALMRDTNEEVHALGQKVDRLIEREKHR